METERVSFELTTDTAPWMFKCLGVQQKFEEEYATPQSDFKKDQIYELTDGKFPLTNHHDLNTKYKLDGKDVILDRFNNSCEVNKINKFGKCRINVIVNYNKNNTNNRAQEGGKKHKTKRKSKGKTRKVVKKNKKRATRRR